MVTAPPNDPFASIALPDISDQDFAAYQDMLRRLTGISLGSQKKAFVSSRLAARIRERKIKGFRAYFDLIQEPGETGELQIAINLLTTNETYFFREQAHFDFVRDKILGRWKKWQSFRAWSAACSSGEEAYSLAMIAADLLGDAPWEIVGTDISTKVLDKARKGHYLMYRIEGLPLPYLHEYCLKGTGSQHGTFLIGRELRDRVKFLQANLCEPMQGLGSFDLVLLRNVLIYFDLDVRKQVLSNVTRQLKSGGYLFVSHTESLNGVTKALEQVSPSIYRKP